MLIKKGPFFSQNPWIQGNKRIDNNGLPLTIYDLLHTDFLVLKKEVEQIFIRKSLKQKHKKEKTFLFRI